MQEYRLSTATPLRTLAAWLVLVPAVAGFFLVALIDRFLGLPLLFPRGLAALAKRKQWCVDALKKGGALAADAEVTDFRVLPLSDTVAFRSSSGFVKLACADGRSLDCFVKFAPTQGSLWNRCVFNVQLNALKEVLFNKHVLASDPQIPAPRPYAAYVEPLTGNLCLITERMAPAKEYREDEPELPAGHLDQALDGLAALHARCWGNRAHSRFVFPIGPQVVRWFDSLVALQWSPAARRILVHSWSRMNEHETVLHGDARVGNMLFGERFVLIDWQAVRRGKAAFDLAYFLVLSLPPERRRAVEQDSIARYHCELQARGVTGYTADALAEDYGHACLSVLVLLSLPLLSGEASADASTARGFVYGMGLWRERLRVKLDELDFAWLASRYGISEAEGRSAVTEMLGVIERRLAKIAAGARLEARNDVS